MAIIESSSPTEAEKSGIERSERAVLTRDLDASPEAGGLTIPPGVPPAAHPVSAPQPTPRVPAGSSNVWARLGIAAIIGGGALQLLGRVASWDPPVERYRGRDGKFKRWW
ncbi:MAG: hypothetical protein SFV15_16515 [Polyangiaceae bacterium]|nr:hypothetical protein [Polyangiaceae bacterium]